MTIQQDRSNRLMPIRKDVRFHHHLIAHDPFDGETARIHFRDNRFDRHTPKGVDLETPLGFIRSRSDRAARSRTF
jgi:hypothetical protein